MKIPDFYKSYLLATNSDKATGVLTHTGISHVSSRSGTYYSCDVIYTYKYRGEVFEGRNLDLALTKPHLYAEAASACGPYKVGKKIDVTVSQRSPSISVLETDQLQRNILFLGGVFAFIILNAFILYVLRLKFI